MRITPWTPAAELHRLINRTYREQAVNVLVSVINIMTAYGVFRDLPVLWYPIGIANLAVVYFSYVHFASAAKARTDLRVILAFKERPQQ